MKKIFVVVAYKSADMFWPALIQSLNTAADIEVGEARDNLSLKALLGRRRPTVVLTELAHFAESDSDCSVLLKRFPVLSVIILDPAATEAEVRLHDLKYDFLLRLIRILAAQADESSEECSPNINMVDTACITKAKVRLEQVPTPYASTGEHLKDLRQWLNLCLHQRLAQETDTPTASTPGWALSAQRARSLLSDNYASADGNALLKARIEIESEIAAREAISLQQDAAPLFVACVNAFGLSPDERRMLIYVLAVELDGCYGRVYGYLNDDLNRRRPTSSLLGELALGSGCIAWNARQILEGASTLSTHGLVIRDPQDSSAGSEVGLMVAKEVVTYLLNGPDVSAYGAHLKLVPAKQSLSPNDETANITSAITELMERLTQWRKTIRGGHLPPVIQLVGGDSAVAWFERVATHAGDSLVVFDIAAIKGESELSQLDYALGAARVTVLHNAILLITGMGGAPGPEQKALDSALISRLQRCVQRLVVHSHYPCVLPSTGEIWQVEYEFPGIRARATLWWNAARQAGLSLSELDAKALAATVGFDEPEIEATLRLSNSEVSRDKTLEVIKAAARKVSRSQIPNTLRRIETVFDWSDIVLPEASLILLKQIPNHVRYGAEVLEDWEYRSRLPYGCGVAALFSGPSGTGKTMAAQIIARDLGVELFQIDLAKTVSKYIGETEKNLDKIFEAAERASAVLLFDEADTIFGKRTEVKDAHDRYANLETGYLLQRMESYRGLAILTTNFARNVDSAFMRRLRFVIDFPAPDASCREVIWRQVFPPQVLFADDVDFEFLARRLNLTGGHIQQVALRAAFAAVSEGSRIAMRHVVRATRDELTKLGMLNAERALADLVPPKAVLGVNGHE